MELYLIAGRAGSGKDTLATFMKEHLEQEGKNVCILRLANPLYEMAEHYFGYPNPRKEKPRSFLQTLGIEIIKEKLGKEWFLVDRLSEDISILDSFFDVGIISDARLVEEMEELKRRYPKLIRILIQNEKCNTSLTDQEKTHRTEIEAEQYSDYDEIVQNTTLEELKISAKQIVDKKRGEEV